MEKRYIELEKVKEEYVFPYVSSLFKISEILVDESKEHIDNEEAIRRVREELRKSSLVLSRSMLEEMLEKISMTKEEIINEIEYDEEQEKFESYLDKIAHSCKKLNESLKEDLF